MITIIPIKTIIPKGMTIPKIRPTLLDESDEDVWGSSLATAEPLIGTPSIDDV